MIAAALRHRGAPRPAQHTRLPTLPAARATDTLMIARARFPGSPASLDALCRRFGIDNSMREKHGALLDAETKEEPKRWARLTAAYNRGYRSFAAVYTSCTSAALRAEENYRNEGATLATEITARYGN